MSLGAMWKNSDHRKELKFLEELIQTIQRKRKNVYAKNSVHEKLFESLLLQNLRRIYAECKRPKLGRTPVYPTEESNPRNFCFLMEEFIKDLTTHSGLTREQALSALQSVSHTILSKHPFSMELASFIQVNTGNGWPPSGEGDAEKYDNDSTAGSLTDEENDFVYIFKCALKKYSQSSADGVTYDTSMCLRILVSLLTKFTDEETQHVIQHLGPDRIIQFMNSIMQEIPTNRCTDMITIAEMLCEKYPGSIRWLADSNLPVLLMSIIAGEEIDSGLLKWCVNCLNTMLSAYQNKLPSREVQEYLRNRFIPWLFQIFGESSDYRKEEKFLFVDLVLLLYSLVPLRPVLIKEVCSTEDSRHFLGYLVVIIGNSEDNAIQLPLKFTVDVLSHSWSSQFLSLGFIEYLINLTERRVRSHKEFKEESEGWLKLLKSLCDFVSTIQIPESCQKLLESSIDAAFSWNELPDYEKKCLSAISKSFRSQDESDADDSSSCGIDIEPPFTKTEVKIATSSVDIPCNNYEVLFQLQLLRMLEKLISKLRDLESGDLMNSSWLNSKMADILEFLKRFTRPHAGSFGVKLRLFKFDVRNITFAVDYLDCVFNQVKEQTARRLVLMLLLELCHVFPALIPFALKKELVSRVISSIGSYLPGDCLMFRLSASLLSRFFSTAHQLPDSVSGLMNKDFIKILMDSTEQKGKESADFTEEALTLILAANLHFTSKNNVAVDAVFDCRCPRTVDTYKTWLQKNFDPIDTLNYTQHYQIPELTGNQEPGEQYAILKFYSDLLRDQRSMRLLGTEDLVALIHFISKRFSIMGQQMIGEIPDLLLQYVTDILNNVSDTVKKKQMPCDHLQSAVQKLANKEGPISEIVRLLLGARIQLHSKVRNPDLTSQSLYDVNNVTTDSNIENRFRSQSEVLLLYQINYS